MILDSSSDVKSRKLETEGEFFCEVEASFVGDLDLELDFDLDFDLDLDLEVVLRASMRG